VWKFAMATPFCALSIPILGGFLVSEGLVELGFIDVPTRKLI
jgi:hypothetical protein